MSADANTSLFMLASDQRGSFETGLFGIEGTPTPDLRHSITSKAAVLAGAAR